MSLARRSNAVVLPAVVEGVIELWPRGRRFPRPGPVWIDFGQPISADELAGRSADVTARLTAHLRTQHNRLRERVGRTAIDYN